MLSRFYHLKKTEIVFLLMLILLYSAIAFYQLGDRSAPQTYSSIEGEEEAFEFYLDTAPSEIVLYAPVNDASKYIGIRIYGSENGQDWTKVFDTRDDDTDYTAAMIWYNYPLATTDAMHYIKIQKMNTANRLVLSEVAFYDTAGNPVLAEALNEKSELLLDEPDTIQKEKTRMNSAYFDESYFPASALEMQDHLSVAEMDHPPLGRLIIGIGMSLFGRNPYGFRFMQALAGVIMLPLIYMMAKALFRQARWAMLAALFLALDFMHYTQTRIGTLDAFLVLFIMAMYAFMLFYRKSTTPKGRYLNLFFSALFTGMAVATKWSGCYAAAGLAIIYLYWLIQDIRKDTGIRKVRLKECGFCVLFFILLPLTIYTLSYIPYARTIPDQPFFKTLINHQIQMFTFHTGSQTHIEHPYASRWWTWFLALKPVFYYYEAPPASVYLYATGNPIAWGMGLLGIWVGLLLGIAKRKEEGLFLAIAYLSQLIPWMVISRDTFLYHYFPMVPFLTLGVVFLFKETWCTESLKKTKTGLIIFYTVSLAVSFVLAFPFLFGSFMLWEQILFIRKCFLVAAVIFIVLWLTGWGCATLMDQKEGKL